VTMRQSRTLNHSLCVVIESHFVEQRENSEVQLLFYICSVNIGIIKSFIYPTEYTIKLL
jgi:hypothetical protein